METRRNSGGHRRPHGRDGGRRGGHEGPREPRGESQVDREQAERDFLDEMNTRLVQFVESEERELALEPMNSFRRRLVHNLANTFHIQTESRGEERDRHVYLIKTGSTAAPPREAVQSGGPAQQAPARPAPSAPPRHEREESDQDRSAPRRDASRPPRESRERREPRESREGSVSGGEWDYGSQVFPVDPGAHGVRIALKRDGSIELYQERDRSHVVAERLVTARQFRVRQGKIVQPGEPGW